MRTNLVFYKLAIVPAVFFILCINLFAQDPNQSITLFPADKAKNVNPDTHLVITFPAKPVLGNSGQIRIYDDSNDRLVDILNMKIPPGPKTSDRNQVPYASVAYEYKQGHFTNANTKPGTPSGTAAVTPDSCQLTIIGGFTDAFHFYPVITRNNTATIYPHNNLLDYDKTYYVQIEPGVLTLDDGSFKGISEKQWSFSTDPPPDLLSDF